MTEADIDKAMAAAVSELHSHGGTPEQVEAMIAHFLAFREEAKQAANKVDGIPD